MIESLGLFFLMLVVGSFLIFGAWRVWPITLAFAAVGLFAAGWNGCWLAVAMAGAVGLMVIGWNGGRV